MKVNAVSDEYKDKITIIVALCSDSPYNVYNDYHEVGAHFFEIY